MVQEIAVDMINIFIIIMYLQNFFIILRSAELVILINNWKFHGRLRKMKVFGKIINHMKQTYSVCRKILQPL